MSTQQIDTKKNQPHPLRLHSSFQRQDLVDKGANGLSRISAVVGALVFLLSSSILLLVIGVKLQQIGERMGEIWHKE